MGWHQRVELPRVARHMVSSGAAQKPVAPFLCRALRDGRAQQQLLSASPTGAAPALGGRCAGGVSLCCQSPTPNHPRAAPPALRRARARIPPAHHPLGQAAGTNPVAASSKPPVAPRCARAVPCPLARKPSLRSGIPPSLLGPPRGVGTPAQPRHCYRLEQLAAVSAVPAGDGGLSLPPLSRLARGFCTPLHPRGAPAMG
jgi:hypothetical protein